jgi:sulfotransferase family protein
MTSRASTQEERAKALRAQLVELKERHAAVVANLRQQLGSAKARAAAQEKRAEALRNTLDELKQRHDAGTAQLRKQLDRAKARAATQEERAKALHSTLDELKQRHDSANTKLRERLDTAKARGAARGERAKALRSTLDELKKRHEAGTAKLREQLDTARARTAAEKERAKALSDTLQELRKSNSEAFANLRQQLDTAKARADAQEERAGGLQAQLERATSHAATREEEAKRLRVELAERKHRDRTLTGAVSEQRSADGRGPTLAVDPPIVLIASAGSGGSHLAAVLLAEREPFFTGPEPNLAGRPDLFDRASFGLSLFKGLLRQEPYFAPVKRKDGRDFHLVPTALFTNAESYRLGAAVEKLALLEAVSGWPEMIRYLHQGLVEAGTISAEDVLVEHSPSCAVALAPALAENSGLKVVHLVRDPRDSISSMMARRKAAPQFASLGADESLALTARQWAFLTAAALGASDHPGYLQVAYEELVRKPDEVTEQLCAHFGSPDAPRRTNGALLVGPMDRQPGWAASPTAAVTDASVGRFERDLSAAQLKRLNAMHFDFPELEQEVSMNELIERFAAEPAAMSRS